MIIVKSKNLWKYAQRCVFHALTTSTDNTQRIEQVDDAPTELRQWYRDKLDITLPSIKGPLRNLDLMKQRQQFYYHLGVSAVEFGELISQAPHVMDIEHSNQARANLAYLLSLGLSTFLMCHVVMTSPAVLTLSLEAHLKPRVAFYKEELNYNTNEMLKLFEECPVFLQYSIVKDIRHRVRYFKRMGMTDEEITKAVILECPQVLGSTFYEEIVPRLEYIRKKTTTKCLYTVLCDFPHSMMLSKEDQLMPFVEYFSKELSMSRFLICQLLQNYPRVLTANVDREIRPKIEYLKGLGLDQLQVFRVVIHRPQILKKSLREGLIKKIDELIGMGIPSDVVATLLVKSPRFFS